MNLQLDIRGGCLAIVDADKATSPGLGHDYPGVIHYWRGWFSVRRNCWMTRASDRAKARRLLAKMLKAEVKP